MALKQPITICAALLMLASTAPSWSYTDDTYESIALNSLRLMPPGLYRIAKRHQDQMVKGALTPLANEGGAEHLAAPRGIMEQRIAEQTERVIDLINKRMPFETIIYELGVLSHFVADLNNPLNTATGDPRYEKIRRDFESYLARKTPKFLLTFKGHNSRELAQNNVRGFAEGASTRSANFGPYLSRSYFPNGTMISSRSFDDRHTAFGVASLTYQNAIGDCARLYVYIWRRVNGDLRGTPHYGQQAKNTERTEGVFRW